MKGDIRNARREQYIEIIESADYRVSSRDIAAQMYICHNQVIRDLKALGLFDMWIAKSGKKSLKNREEFYEEHYFNAQYKPTHAMLARKLNLTPAQVGRDIKKLKEQKGLLN